MARRRTWIGSVAGVAVAMVALAGCEKASEGDGAGDAGAGATAVEPAVEVTCEVQHVTGCRTWLKAGPTCEPLLGSELVIWLSGPTSEEQVEVVVDGEPVEVDVEAAAGGWRAEVPSPRKAEALGVRVKGKAEPCWTLALQDDSTPDSVGKLRALLKKGDAVLAMKEAATAIAKLGGGADAERALMAMVQAEAAVKASKKDEAKAAYEAAIAAARKAGRLSEMAEAARDLANMLHDDGKDAEALKVLDGVWPDMEGYDDGVLKVGYRLSVVNRELDHYGAAWRYARDVLALAKKAGTEAYQTVARQAGLAPLLRGGRGPDACKALKVIADGLEGRKNCQRKVRALNGHVMCWLLEGDMGGEVPGDLDEVQDEALTAWTKVCPYEESYGAEAHFGKALLKIRAGDPKAAARHVEDARGTLKFLPFHMDVWARYLEARAQAEAGKHAEALQGLDALERILKDAGFPAYLYRIQVARAHVYEAKGDDARAAEALKAAYALLSDHAALLRMGTGRASFLGDVEETAELAEALKVDTGLEARTKARDALETKIDIDAPMSQPCEAYIAARMAHDKHLLVTLPDKPHHVPIWLKDVKETRKKLDEAYAACFEGAAAPEDGAE